MTEQPNLFADDTYSALENAVAALGGVKRVGYHLRPEMGPGEAGMGIETEYMTRGGKRFARYRYYSNRQEVA